MSKTRKKHVRERKQYNKVRRLIRWKLLSHEFNLEGMFKEVQETILTIGAALNEFKGVDDTLRRTVNILNKISVSVPARHAGRDLTFSEHDIEQEMANRL